GSRAHRLAPGAPRRSVVRARVGGRGRGAGNQRRVGARRTRRLRRARRFGSPSRGPRNGHAPRRARVRRVPVSDPRGAGRRTDGREGRTTCRSRSRGSALHPCGEGALPVIPYFERQPTGTPVPLLVSIPHTGTEIPVDISLRLAPGASPVADTDW